MSYMLMCICMSCSIMQNHKRSKRVKLGDLVVYMNTNYKFHYLTVIDKKNQFDFIYPVGFEDIEFRGEPGPIFSAKKHERKTDRNLYIITNENKDSVCFLKYCFVKSGELVDFDVDDKQLIEKLDSFCKAKYPFYKTNVHEFKKWYKPRL